MAPIARAVTLLLAAGGMMGNAHAQQAFSPAWFAAKGAAQSNAAATGYMPNGTRAALLANPAQQQQQANAQLQRSLNNLGALAQGIAAQQAAQEAARQAALANGGSVPDGLTEGGLKVDTNSLTRGWINASAPTQSTANGKTTVSIAQSADKAILNWETFNVGKNTAVNFQQQASWAVLNRVNDPQARPSQIQGQISGNGTVMIVNRNGIVFAGGSQIDTRNLAASAVAMSDAQFKSGLYSAKVGEGSFERYTPSFGNDLAGLGDAATVSPASGEVRVQPGARINTAPPASVTQGGGYVLLLGREVHNAGQIVTPAGQTVLAAGDSFIIRKGLASDANTISTTRGNEVSARRNANGSAGLVVNSGLIQAPVGDITLTGQEVRQAGVALSSTTVAVRGTVHLLNSASDAGGKVVLGAGSYTAVLPQDDGALALDTQRDALQRMPDVGDPYRRPGQAFDHLMGLPDRGDQSRIEVGSGGTVEVQAGALALATGGQIVISAARRTLLDNGAVLDVAGAVGVKLAMESNNVKVNIQGNEQRDAPLNRDSKTLNNSDVWVDRRTLVAVAKGVNGYERERWYTQGGLLEVGGYLGTTGHGIGEWTAVGGTVTVAGGELVSRAGAQVNISGGTLDVQSGYLRQSWLRGEDGRLYEVSRAPGDLLYKGVYKGFESTHARWGEKTTEYFYNPLIAPNRRYEEGYTVGRDAGRLVVATRTARLEGEVIGEVYQGPRQIQERQVLDVGLRQQSGYRQSQYARALAGQLLVGRYVPQQLLQDGVLRWGYNLAAAARGIVIADGVTPTAGGIGLDDPLLAEGRESIVLDAGRLNGMTLGQITALGSETVAVQGGLQTSVGGSIALYGPQVTIGANLTARGGRIAAGNLFEGVEREGMLASANGSAQLAVAPGVVLDVSGVVHDLRRDPEAAGDLAYRHGGRIALRGTGALAVGAGSELNADAGLALSPAGKVIGGKGGDVAVEMASSPDGSGAGTGPVGVSLAGQVHGYGVSGGGTLRLSSRLVRIGGSDAPAGTIVLPESLFQNGFARYDINGDAGLEVADGVLLRPVVPVLRVNPALPESAALAQRLERWLPPLFQDDPLRAQLTQRQGASLVLGAFTAGAAQPVGGLRIGSGALLEVDPGQGIELRARGLLRIEGTLRAPGGRIEVRRGADASTSPQLGGLPNSVWVGEQARLDVGGLAVTAVDALGRRYGRQFDGGRIALDGEFVVIRPGAVLEASATRMTVDMADDGTGAGVGPRTLGGQGGEIALTATAGLYLDGAMRAAAGAPGGRGGSLSVRLETPVYASGTADVFIRPRELVIAQQAGASVLPANVQPGDSSLTYGYGRIGVDRIAAGGFDDVALNGRDLVTFDGDVTLTARHAVTLYQGALSNTRAGATVRIVAPYVLLSGRTNLGATISQQVEATINTWMPSTLPGASLLQVEAEQIDTRDRVNAGLSGSVLFNDGRRMAVERRGYETVALRSRGDLRFLPASADVAGVPIGGQAGVSAVLTSADLLLAAQRIYPATGAKGLAVAGMISNRQYDARRVLRVEGVNGPLAGSAPLSVFGSLALNAPNVEQGGAVYAPLGLIALGIGIDGINRQVRLLPGSLTSVSAAGLTVPFGGTVDGLSYLYQDAPVNPMGIGGMGTFDITRGVALLGGAIAVEPGAVIDLSGGGKLAGAAFISGRGGSTDPLFHPLPRFDGATGRLDLPTLGDRPVYAILPGFASGYAPVARRDDAANYAGSRPLAGETVTLQAGIPGLPAGTYTLLPSYYALLPGAFRVELGQAATGGAPLLSRGGSWSVGATRGLNHTGTADAVARQVLITPGEVVRRHAQYNEMDYRAFMLAEAARTGQPRQMLPEDAAALELFYRDRPDPAVGPALRFDGQARFGRAEGGYGGQLVVRANGIELEIAKSVSNPAYTGISLADADLNAIRPGRLSIGGWVMVSPFSPDRLTFQTANANNIYLRSGAELRMPEVMLIAPDTYSIALEQGASINTLGMGAAPFDSRLGYRYGLSTASMNVMVVSNGWLDFANGVSTQNGSIGLGADCSAAACSAPTRLYSEGTIALGTSNLVAHESFRYGTRNLVLAASALNVGSEAALADAQARGVLPNGLRLSQSSLNRLLEGDTSLGAPALERVIFSLRNSVNFFGAIDLSTLSPVTGKSALQQLVFNTPAIYGMGAANDVASVTTDTLVWNGVADATADIVNGGPGTGVGRLDLRARRILLGDSNSVPLSKAQKIKRFAVGFSQVNLDAAERITSNGEGSLGVYQSRGAFSNGDFSYAGGNLAMHTPLLTGEAGSVLRLTTGGLLQLDGMAGQAAGPAAIGGTLILTAGSVVLNSVIALPSGKLNVNAERDILLGEAAYIDMAGRATGFFDQIRYGGGGDIELESKSGNVIQAAGSVLDVSARYNHAGSVRAVALDSATGLIDLRGRIAGSASGEYDAGGTLVPFEKGRIVLRGQSVADLVDLNQRLNDGGVTGARAFQIKRGDVIIGDEVKARRVDIAADGGRLIVNGVVDASGAQVGSIRLSAMQDLVINGLLDAHGSLLRVDSRGEIIDSPNRAVVELTSRHGRLVLAGGAAVDLRAGTGVQTGNGPGLHDGRARGTLDLNAQRVGADDVALDIVGAPRILGAERVFVNAFREYTDAPLASAPDITGRTPRVVTQDYLERVVDPDNVAYMNAALANGALRNRLGSFVLRPGVEIVNATADGDLRVDGDLDLSAFRYGPLADRNDPARHGFGEAGVLLIRAKGDLNIYGSITDGFAPPLGTDDDSRAWRLVGRMAANNANGVDLWQQSIILPKAVTLRGSSAGVATSFPNVEGESLNFDAPIRSTVIKAGVRMPTEVQTEDYVQMRAGTVLGGTVTAVDGTVYPAGSILAADVMLEPGTLLGPGFITQQGVSVAAFLLPKGTSLGIFDMRPTLSANLPLAAGAYLPSGATLRFSGGSISLRDLDSNGKQGRIWAVAPMLPAGTESWSLRLAAGADLAAADTRALLPAAQLGASGQVRLADLHYQQDLSNGRLGESPIFSVIRTGKGDLDILAGGDFRQTSFYGIYTAGTQSAPALDRLGNPIRNAAGRDAYNLKRANDPDMSQADGRKSVLGMAAARYEALVGDGQYAAWYPERGGNVYVGVQGSMRAATRGISAGPSTSDTRGAGWMSGGYTGTWLWRQGGEDIGQDTAWWINFGTYVPTAFYSQFRRPGITVEGFTGIGALGGGNVAVEVAGDAGIHRQPENLTSSRYPYTDGLVLAVGSTGRVRPDGTRVTTGGGDLSLRVNGALNPFVTSGYGQTGAVNSITSDMNGVFTNLRGALDVTARSIGHLEPMPINDPSDSRPRNSDVQTLAAPSGGIVIVPGDATVRLSTAGDLVLGGVGDAGRSRPLSTTPFIDGGIEKGGGAQSWFSLWSKRTGIDLYAAGGSVTPIASQHASGNGFPLVFNDSPGSEGYLYPSRFSAVAASGNIYYHQNPNGNYAWIFAPGLDGHVALLAGRSLNAGGMPAEISGAPLAVVPTPERPAYSTNWSLGATPVSKTNAIGQPGALFAFGANTAEPQGPGVGNEMIRFYALDDIVGLQTGFLGVYSSGNQYHAARPVSIVAGRDIVNLKGLLLNQQPTDISRIVAGRDILYANVDIAGPGWLEVSAGRNLRQEDRGRLGSLGPIDGKQPSGKGGAGIVVSVGGEGDYAALARQYLNPANRADPSLPLADQGGRVVKTYEGELLDWLRAAHGYAGAQEQALGYFDALPTGQQRVFLRQVYYAELAAGGREYNDTAGPRLGSYLRGRQAIAALFPEADAQGRPIRYQGDITMFGASGIQTLFGGPIHLLAPGGQMIFGVEGAAPPSTAGVVTQGAGDIQMYAQGSILLGQSRVMTTFGGHIMAWSAQGDINSGRGSKSTVVYTPQRRQYDETGNVSLSPTVPSTGAGIATLAPIPEVPAGDVDLVAPLGTIDVGEAGIRVSGNINVAALQVVNAANIQVQGKASGLPVVAAVNVGALTNASAAASSAAMAAQDAMARDRAAARQNLPSVFTVRVLGFGNEPPNGGAQRLPEKNSAQSAVSHSYNPSSLVQVIGLGRTIDSRQWGSLTQEERRQLERDR